MEITEEAASDVAREVVVAVAAAVAFELNSTMAFEVARELIPLDFDRRFFEKNGSERNAVCAQRVSLLSHFFEQ